MALFYYLLSLGGKHSSMNKVILMGRLTRAPEVRYTQSDAPLAVARYTLAVNRKFKRDGDQDADFINCVALGKSGEFAEKYLKKGQQICIVGRMQVRNYDDQTGQRHWITEIMVEEQYFAESKSTYDAYLKSGEGSFSSGDNTSSNTIVSSGTNLSSGASAINQNASQVIDTLDDEDLPF